MAGPAAVITVQGLYTLLWLGSRLPLRRGSADLVFAMGETAALVAGATGVVAALISKAGTPDPEYGPPTMLTLVAIHGLVGLLAALRELVDQRHSGDSPQQFRRAALGGSIPGTRYSGDFGGWPGPLILDQARLCCPSGDDGDPDRERKERGADCLLCAALAPLVVCG